MKTLTDPKITVTGDQITICATIKDLPFNGLLVTRVSHGHVNPANPSHPRRIQSSNEAVFVEAPGEKVSFPNSFVAAIAAAVAPKTTFAPILDQSSTPGDVKVISELPYTVQWQQSDDAMPKATKPDTLPPQAVWTDIAGENSEKLDESAVKVGQWIRCVLSNASGVRISNPAQKK